MLITNSSSVVPRNLIHKYKHALLNKSFKVFINKREKNPNLKQKKNMFLKKHTQIERNCKKT